MKKYYSVTSAFYDDGRVVAGITGSREAESKPESRCTAKSDRDIYEDWFESMEEAGEFVEETKKS